MKTVRTDPPRAGGERALLTGWLDFYRATIEMKCEGLDRRQLAEAAVAPSHFSLLGLVRHLSEMERGYFRNGIGGENLPLIYCSDKDPDGDFLLAASADPDEAFTVWREERKRANQVIARSELSDAPAAGSRHSVRWALVKVIGEYARHTGHADLLRERIDGATGD